VFEDVLHFGASHILQQAAQQAQQQAAHQAQQQQPAGSSPAAAAGGGDTEMADAAAQDPPQAGAAPAAAAAAASSAAAGYSEEQVQQLLAANPSELLAQRGAQPAAAGAAGQQPAAGEGGSAASQQQETAAAAGHAAAVSCPLGAAGSGLEAVTVVDLSAVRSELEDGGEVDEAEAADGLEVEAEQEGGLAGTLPSGGGGDAEASRAEAAAAAARQWEALLHDCWQELQREEEAALRAAGHEADGGDEHTNDEAEDVSDVWRCRAGCRCQIALLSLHAVAHHAAVQL
jgi:hypothetical protein